MDTTVLAAEFSRIIRRYLTPDELAEVVRRNNAEPDSRICHSHDYIDANQAMIDSLDNLAIEYDPASDSQTADIDQAWTIAKQAGFSL